MDGEQVGWILFLVGLLALPFFVWSKVQSNVKKAATRDVELDRALRSYDGFHASKTLRGSDRNSALAIDEATHRILFVTRYTPATALSADGAEASAVLDAWRQLAGFETRVYAWRDILACGVLEDGETVTRTSRSSQLGGALLGGLAFGPVGALVGALSGKTTAQGAVKRVELALTVNDTSHPVHRVALLSQVIKVSKSSIEYKTVAERAKDWSAMVAIIIRQADAEDQAEVQRGSPPSPARESNATVSVADEIRKLSKLREDGLITDAEFKAQKGRLLDRG